MGNDWLGIDRDKDIAEVFVKIAAELCPLTRITMTRTRIELEQHNFPV